MAALVTLLMICTPVAVQCQNLTDSQVELISVSLADAAKASWELGTRAQAILSLNATGFSVYSSTSLPPPTSIEQFGDGNATGLAPLFDIARTTVLNRGASNGNVTGPQPLMKDGSAADPASIGFAVLLANWTQQDESTVDYVGAAKDQLDFLYQVVPKTSDGAFSHRVAEVQLWSDFVYMVPPFLAYYGVLTRNRTLLLEAYNQIKLYRNYLRDSHAGGLWKHVLLGASGNDEGHWSTGNAWAAAGMLRVLATFQHSEYANTLKHQQNDLAGWAIEIQNAMYTHLDNTLVFANYPDLAPDTPGNFYDASSTALLASTVYRVSLLWGEHSHLPIAERSRQALFGPSSSSATPTFTSDSPISSTSNSTASNSTTTNSTTANTVLSNMAHFTTEGYLTPVVNPHSYGREGSKSAEAQAFVVELHSAWRDWIADGAKGANGARRTMGWPVIPLYGWVAWACILLGGWLV
ncbi:hypothetical protein AMATHDRAFT_70070 [Amanita thiersii Skay4041]|uniref:Glycoside hydrolase family 105 protein n=1 Tax=Amanita thiersii Skay4041 TaxID=703135 RepID=A0A2A9N801_9AGAR|nr:hypothetical protein AMATHDRAFT_70070 [Amanita thiersii Skay4041]